MHVTVVTETWPPEVNGVAATLAQLVAALSRAGHELRLIRPRQHPMDRAAEQPVRELLVRGWPVPRYPHLRMGLPCGGRLRELWTAHRPDVVHIATEGPLGWSALRAARQLRIAVSSDFRTNFHAYGAYYGARILRCPIMAYLRWFHNAATFTTVPTAGLRDELARAGLQRLAVIGRGVDTRRFDPAHRSAELRRKWGVSEEPLVVGYVGRLAAEKNLCAVADAFAAIRVRESRARLVVVGDGPARDDIKSRCPDAVLTGSKHGNELAAHYASLDLLLFPSRTETFGNVAVEAMASGVPVVAFNDAAAGQLIETGVNGWLAPLDQPERYTPVAVEASLNRSGLYTIGQRARATVMALNWDAIAAQVETLWRTQLMPRSISAAQG
jgi:glycosyltransferase involved in cell wall biosynthesis